ncbi:MAG: hypothetical protein ACR2G0_01400, partial [Chthoniobacterales bacterium]
ASKVVSNYRDHADNLEKFSRLASKEIAAHQWRYAVIEGNGGGSQGMLLYMQKLHFLPSDQAVSQWNSGTLDALVVPKKEIDRLLPQLQNASLLPLRTQQRKSIPHVGYLLVARRGS